MKVGDCVNRKLGGCLMTVSAVDDERVDCFWFDDNQQPQTGIFQRNDLQVWVQGE